MLPAGHILSCERCIGHIDDLRENLKGKEYQWKSNGNISMEMSMEYLNQEKHRFNLEILLSSRLFRGSMDNQPARRMSS